MANFIKKLTSSLGGVAVILSAAALLLCPSVTANAAARGLQICAKSILPALFPFFVLTRLWISLGYADQLSHLAMPVMEPVFHLPGAAASALLLGCIGGYPVGAQITAQLYQSHSVDREEAQRMLFFCNNAGPAFIFGIVGTGVFQSVAIGGVLYLIHIGSAVLLGILFRPSRRTFHTASLPAQIEKRPFSSAFTASVREAGTTVLQVCVFVLFFSILTGFLSHFTPASLQKGPWFSVILGSLELAGGANLLASAACSAVWKLCGAAFLLGWGGLCVHSQTLSILDGAGLPAGSYLLGKLLHGFLSAVLALLVSPLLPLPVTCGTVQMRAWQTPVLQMLLLTIFLLWAGRFLKITTGKPSGNRL